MSEDGLPDPLEDPPMEVIVETLTGTVFDIRVYPTETFLDIKHKIQRVEGIPVHHQSLLYQMHEMSDYASLGESGITHGSVLKLVLSIRGGPISTRRFTACDHHILWRDLKELIENSQADSEPGSKVSVLVYKDGDILNVLRVVENEDGSYSPYQDRSLEAAQPPQEYAAEGSGAAAFDVAQSEAFATLNVDESQCIDDHLESEGVTPSVLDADSIFDPPAQPQVPFHWPPYILAQLEAPPPEEEDESDTESESDPAVLKMNEDVEMANKLLRLKRRMRHMRAMRCAKSNPPAGVTIQLVEDTIDMGLEELALKEKHRSRSNRPSTGYLHNLHVFDPLPAYYEQAEEEYAQPQPQHHRLRMSHRLFVPEPEQELLEEAAGQSQEQVQVQCKVGLLQRRASLDYDGADFGLGPLLEPAPAEEPDDLFYRLPTLPRYTTSASPLQPAPACMTRSPLYGRLSRNSNDNYLTPLAQSPSPELPDRNSCNIERVQNDYIDYEDLEQDVFGYYNTEFDKYIASGIPPPTSLVSGSSGLDLSANFYRAMEEAENEGEEEEEDEDEEEEEEEEGEEEEDEYPSIANEIKKLTLRSDFQVQVGQMPAESSAATGAVKRELPPVVTKKRMRCGQCNKRLNITNIYNCRCGLIFCAQHRYSEAHDCKYDYKAEGRKLIEQQNPLVTASKFTKF